MIVAVLWATWTLLGLNCREITHALVDVQY